MPITSPDEAWQTAQELFSSGKLDEAEQMLLQVLAQFPNHAPSHDLLGFHYLLRGQCQLAEELFLKAIELEPAVGASYYHLGMVYLARKNYSLALACTRAAWQLLPEHAAIQKQLVQLLLILKVPDAGLESLALQSPHAQFWHDLGKLARQHHCDALANHAICLWTTFNCGSNVWTLVDSRFRQSHKHHDAVFLDAPLVLRLSRRWALHSEQYTVDTRSFFL